ncbi:MAG: DUF2851 family protein [Opitutales bacterium]
MFRTDPVAPPADVPERLVQRLWLRQAFRHGGLRTLSGKPLRIRRPGRWNHHEGPDFRDSLLEIDGQPVRGDVELHLRRRDWSRHGHQADANYGAVALHVVVFPPTVHEQRALTHEGREPETVVLLDWLERDLAALAAEEALLESTQADPVALAEPLAHLTPEALRRSLRAKALRRWRQKRRFAARRRFEHGFTEACHQLLLEGLGYSRNREPMARLALEWPLRRWTVDPPPLPALLRRPDLHWKRAGVRPPNQPARRLEQYQRLVDRRPDWPRQLQAWGRQLPGQPEHGQGTRAFRQDTEFSAQRAALASGVFANVLGGTRLDTLLADVCFPLLAEELKVDLFGNWFHARAGDGPHALLRLERLLPLTATAEWPRCNGWLQALLEHCIEGGVRA